MVAPFFFTVNGGKVNCAYVVYQAELPRIIAEMLGVLEPQLGEIDGLDRLATCEPTTPTNPCAYQTFGDLDVVEHLGEKYGVVPIHRIRDYIRQDRFNYNPVASNYEDHLYRAPPFVDGYDKTISSYYVHANTKDENTDDEEFIQDVFCRRYVLAPREHLNMFAQ